MQKRTKIVATIGPASDKKEILLEMVKAGMNVARINFSHGTHESNGQVITLVREISKELELPVGIIADLQGPRIRTSVEKDVEVETGELIIVADTSVDFNFEFKILNFESISNEQILNLKTSPKKIFLDWPGIIKDMKVGENILIEDGLKRLRVVEKSDNFLVAEVINGGIIKNHKGVNVPDTSLHFGAVTKKDEDDLAYAMSREVDFVALSFVSNGQEIEETRSKMKAILGRDNDIPHIIAKIERKEAMKNIDEIIKASDVIMVARGDLGIEMDESKVVLYQKEIIKKCLLMAKPVIVATQMLDSMIENPIPTRAEVADVSNAVIDHADATMLSGESANGKYPLKAVETMAKIITDTEESTFDDCLPSHVEFEKDDDPEYRGVIASAWKMSQSTGAKAVMATSVSGITARLLSNYRAEMAISVATASEKVFQQMSIVWGVEPHLFIKQKTSEKMIELLMEKAKKSGKIEKGDRVVVVINDDIAAEKILLVGLKEIK